MRVRRVRHKQKEKMNVQVIRVRRYNFKADDGGQVKMSKVTFLDGPLDASEDDMKGLRVEDVSADYGLYEQFTKVPGYYELELGLRGKSARIRSAKLDESRSTKSVASEKVSA